MTKEQARYLERLNPETARRLVDKFDRDPETAADKSEAAYLAFCAAWEVLNPGEYIQRYTGPQGPQYNYITC